MAIAFDTFGTVSNAGGSTVTWTHTVGASLTNGLMTAQLLGNGTFPLSNLVFAGQALTKVIAGTHVGALVAADLWFLKNPPAGLGTFVGTYAGTMGVEIDAVSVSYQGVDQTTQFVGSSVTLGTSTAAGSVIDTTLTGGNLWFGGIYYDNNTPVLNIGVARGTAIAGGGLIAAESSGTIQGTNSNAVSNWVMLGAEMKAFVAAGAVSGYLSLLGVGKT